MFNEYAFGNEECKILALCCLQIKNLPSHNNAYTRLLLQLAKAFVFISG